MSRKIYKDKYYTHLDVKKHHKDYQQRVQNINWVSRHGFYPFIHFKMDCSKYTFIENGKKILSQRKETYIMLHILTDLYMSIMETVLITDTMSI